MTKLIAAALAASVLGCKSFVVSESQVSPVPCEAGFRPQYALRAQSKIVRGEAHEAWKWWGLVHQRPQIKLFNSTMDSGLSVRDAAARVAADSAGAMVLIAPHFTVVEKQGWLGFDGSTYVSVIGFAADLVGVEPEYKSSLAPSAVVEKSN